MPGRWRRWGAIRWRAHRRRGPDRAVPRAAATPRRPTRPGARGPRHTAIAEGEPITSPNARYLQWRAVLTGEPAGPADADVGDRRVPAAQPAAGGRVRSPCIRPARSSSGPFSTGELEIAGFEDNTSDGRPPSPTPVLRQPAARRRRRVARARPPDLSEGAADARLEGGRRERRPAAVRRALSPRRGDGVEDAEARVCGIPSSSGTRRRCPTAPTS